MTRTCFHLLLAGLIVLVPRAALAQAQDVVIYYHTDALGSVRMITDAAGQEIQRYDYLPFGEPWPASAPADSKQFTGQERDTETKLDQFGARYYSSNMGRFTSPDDPGYANPSDPQSLNLYVYVRNNPLRFVDRSGHSPCPVVQSDAYACVEGKAVSAELDWGTWLFFWSVDSYELQVARIQGFFEGVRATIAALDPSSETESCLQLFARETLSNLNPLTPSGASVAEGIGATAAAVEWNRAMRYAAQRPNYLGGRGLLYPMKSSVARPMIQRSRLWASRTLVIAEGLAMTQALATEWNAFKSGDCR